MKRSRFENDKELIYNLRINGRILAAYRLKHMAEDMAYALAGENRSRMVEVEDQYGDPVLKLMPAADNLTSVRVDDD